MGFFNQHVLLRFVIPVSILIGLVYGAVLLRERNLEIEADKQSVPGGDAAQGEQLIEWYGCGSCHRIDGIPTANSMVGPPLTDLQKRHYLAGEIINNPDNLIAWIMNPQEIEPGTAMPDLGIPEDEARHIAAYLYQQ